MLGADLNKPLARSNSYENFNRSISKESLLDGHYPLSLYSHAVIL